MRQLILLLMIFDIGCKSHDEPMKYKNFTSDKGLFSMQIPATWSEYEDEADTYAFFDTAEWTGNFRITHLTSEIKTDTNKADVFVQDELKGNPSAVKTKTGQFSCAFYKKYTTEENKELVVYYWTLGKDFDLFVCTFTTDKNREDSEENKLELQKVTAILKSIKTQ